MLGTMTSTNSNYHPLVPGTIREIVDGQKPSSIYLQVIYVKPIEKESSSGAPPRYKVAVSDSRNFIQAMVVSPLSLLFEQKVVEQWNIIRVTSYQLNTMKGHVFLVLGNMVQEEVVRAGHKYGEPTNVEQTMGLTGIKDNNFFSNMNTDLPRQTTTTTTAAVATAIPPTSSVAPNRPTPFQSNIGNVDVQKNFSNNSSTSNAPPIPGGYYEEPENLQAIANLSPYHNRWAIKARITNKTDIKKFSNAKGEGKLFSCTCIDQSGEIRMTAFGEVVDRFFDIVQEGQVYCISNAQVKIAKRQFGVRNEYEIHLEPTSLITLSREGTDTIPSARYAFVSISQIVNLEKDNTCDVIGVVREVGELSNIVTKTTQKSLSKRDLTISDSSNCSIKVTLWGSQAENFQISTDFPIVAIKGARVSDYNGRTLSTVSSSTISLNPDILEAHELRGWFDSQGINETSKSLSSNATNSVQQQADDRKFVNQIKEDYLGTHERPDFFSILASIVYIKSDSSVSYTACPTEGCNKKVIEEGPNMWRCEKCQKVFDRCDHRYILSLQIGDHTGQTWVNAFNDTGEHILGKTAEELYYLKMSDEAAYTATFKEALFKSYVFRIRAKQESYQGENKLRCNIMSVTQINPTQEAKLLVDRIEKAL